MANKFNKHVIVVGSARSGTSWLSETLAQPFRYRMLFEPEQETQTQKGHLLCDKFLTSKQDSVEAYKYLTKVFKNQVDCDWIAQNSNRKWKRHLWPFVAKKFIIKFVRCNLSAHFLNSEFGIPIIHILRNPYDIILSQEQVKFSWLYDLSHFIKQDKLVQLVLEKFDYDIRATENLTDVEKLALRWCIENVIPLESLDAYSGRAAVVRYEDLSKNINLFYSLCKDFNLEPVRDLQKYFKQPSSKTHPKGSIFKNDAEKISMTNSAILEINKILDIFKTKLYERSHRQIK